MNVDTELLSIQRIYKTLQINPIPNRLSGLDVFLPVLEVMRKEGAVVLLKWDGLRDHPNDNGPYTALVSGKPLNGSFFRTDADSLEEALVYIVTNYARSQWGVEV